MYGEVSSIESEINEIKEKINVLPIDWIREIKARLTIEVQTIGGAIAGI